MHWVLEVTLEAKWNRAHVSLAIRYDGVRDIPSSYHMSLPSCSLAALKSLEFLTLLSFIADGGNTTVR